MPSGIRSPKPPSRPLRKRRRKPNQSSASNSGAFSESREPVSSLQEAAKWSGVRFGGRENQVAWDRFAHAAIIGWLSRGVLGANDDLASECAVFADLMMAERVKRFT
jgi:hypothetical protein